MTSTDPIIEEFVAVIKRDISAVESADELLTIGALIVHVLAPQAQDTA